MTYTLLGNVLNIMLSLYLHRVSIVSYQLQLMSLWTQHAKNLSISFTETNFIK